MTGKSKHCTRPLGAAFLFALLCFAPSAFGNVEESTVGPETGRFDGGDLGSADDGGGGCGGGGCCQDMGFNATTGSINEQSTDVTGFKAHDWFGHTRTYVNRMSGTYDGANGRNWFVSQRPFLKQVVEGSTRYYAAVIAPDSAVWFTVALDYYQNETAYTPRFGEIGVALTHSGDVYTLTMAAGAEVRKYEFYDYSQTTKPRGQFKSYTDRTGTVSVSSASGSRIYSMTRTLTIDGTTTSDKIYYTHIASGTNASKLDYIRTRRYDGTAWQWLLRVDYTYDSAGHLTLAENKMWDSSSSDWDTEPTHKSHYRYHDSGGHLEYVLGPDAYRRADAANGTAPEDILDADVDDDLGPYADAHYLYDQSGFPTTIAQGGSGSCSSCGGSGGAGAVTREISWSSRSAGDTFSEWARKATVSIPSSSSPVLRATTYSNSARQVILRIGETIDGSDVQTQAEFFAYDSTTGLLDLSADTAAIDLPMSSGGGPNFSTLEQNNDLLGKSGGSYSRLRDSAGQLLVRTYPTTTSATTTTVGGVRNYVEYEKIKNGETATETTLQRTQYIKRLAGGVDVYPVAKVLRYVDGSNWAAVTFDYEWHTDTTQIKQITRKRFVVENSTSSNDALEQIEWFDLYGSRLWLKDENGLISYTAYDWAWQRPVEIVVDPDTSSQGFSPLGGVPTPFGNSGGSHRVTSITRDLWGRVTEVVGPKHDDVVISGTTEDDVRTATWVVYDDNDFAELDEARTAYGYVDGTTEQVVGGVKIRTLDKVRRVVDVIHSERSGTGKLLVTESFSDRTKWKSWVQVGFGDGGEPATRRIYHTIPSSGDGTAGTNYGEATFGYDSSGRLRKTTDPAGKSTWTFYGVVANDNARYVESRSYPHVYADGGNDVHEGPIVVTWRDADGNVARRFLAKVTDGDVNLTSSEPDGSDALTSLSRTTTQYDWQGRVETAREYFDLGTLSESQAGQKDVNYYETEHLAYDNLGRLLRTEDPIGDITATVYDAIGRPTETWLGTNATGATRTEPGDGSSNLVQLSEPEYGASGARLTHLSRSKVRQAGDTLIWVTTDYEQDKFGQATKTKPSSAHGGPWVKHTYNSVGLGVETASYENGATTTLLAKSTTIYEGGDRVWAAREYKVDSGQAGNYLETLSEYDGVGRRNAVVSPGSNVVTAWDHAGRITTQTSYADEDRDVAVEEVNYEYDDGGNTIEVATHRRNHDAGSFTGDLSGTPAKAQTTYQVAWYDHAHRSTHVANFGTNGGESLDDYVPGTSGDQAYSAGPPAPDSSVNVIVFVTSYDEAGRVDERTDNAEIVTKHVYDDAGRLTHVVGNYKSGSTYWGTADPLDPDTPKARATDVNRISKSVYDPAGHVVQRIAVDPAFDGTTSADDDQTTKYVYSSDLTDKGTPSGTLQSNSLLRSIIHPDSNDLVSGGALSNGTGQDTVYDREEFTYYANGTPKARKDQRQVEVTSVYYADGRLKARKLPTSADESVEAFTYAHDDLGRLVKVTSHSEPTSDPTSTTYVVNQVVWEYNGLGQLEEESQEHGGVVSSSPSVQYAYDTTASGSELTKAHRATTLTYPNERVVKYDYGSRSPDYLNRIEAMTDDANPATTFVSYDYVGAAVAAIVTYDEADVRLDYFGGTSDTYAGFDRFGRVKTQHWIYGTSTDRDKFVYGYDQAGNPTDRAVSMLSGLDFGQHYSYDDLRRLDGVDIGSVPGPTKYEYDLDQTGNWTNYKVDEDLDQTWDLDQDRTHNNANETTDVEVWDDPVYDLAGNATTIPQPASLSSDFTLEYDSWGRLVRVGSGTGGTTTVAEFEYDARHRRTIRKSYSGGTLSETRHFYYSSRWQVLEETVGTSSETTNVQYVWGARYVDDLVLRDRDADANSGNGLEERLYALHDANFNVTTLVNASGAVQERIDIMPYGQVTFLDASFSNPSSSSSKDWEVIFTGQRYDAVTGLHYFRRRYLHSDLGRFITRDPIGSWGDPGNVGNAYAYAGDSPVGGVDPSGLYFIQGPPSAWPHPWTHKGGDVYPGYGGFDRGSYGPFSYWGANETGGRQVCWSDGRGGQVCPMPCGGQAGGGGGGGMGPSASAAPSGRCFLFLFCRKFNVAPTHHEKTHCFIDYSDAKVKKTFSVVGSVTGEYHVVEGSPVGIDMTDTDNGDTLDARLVRAYGNKTKWPGLLREFTVHRQKCKKCTPGKTLAALKAAVRRFTKAVPTYHAIKGPNSNTFAAHLWTSACDDCISLKSGMYSWKRDRTLNLTTRDVHALAYNAAIPGVTKKPRLCTDIPRHLQRR